MARTYTVHGHMERRDGRKEAFWTRTGLSKSAAQKLAREQRSESGGRARVVAEGGSMRHATKKRPTSTASADNALRRALKTLHDVVNGKIDILASSQSDRGVLRELGYVATNRNGNSYVTKAGKNAVKAIDAAR